MENNTVQNLSELEKIHNRHGHAFVMALSHLFDFGIRHFTADNYNETMKEIDKRHDLAEQENIILIMTRDFEKMLIDCCMELCKYPLMDIFLYIAKYLPLYDPTATENQPDCDD